MRLPRPSEYADAQLLLVRLTVAFAFLFHGMAKWVLWDDYETMSGMLQFLSVAEPLCAVFLAFGLRTRTAAMIGAFLSAYVLLIKLLVVQIDFVSDAGTGWEIDMLMLTACTTLLVFGPGEFALDGMLRTVRPRHRSSASA
jgi:uncharacterized membrane protein YphA (DoxX/SURF4 family)